MAHHRKIYAFTENKTFRILDIATGNELPVFKNDYRFYEAAISPDGKKLIAACTDKTVLVFDLDRRTETGKIIENSGEKITNFTFDYKSKRLAFCSGGYIVISDIKLEEVVRLKHSAVGKKFRFCNNEIISHDLKKIAFVDKKRLYTNTRSWKQY